MAVIDYSQKNREKEIKYRSLNEEGAKNDLDALYEDVKIYRQSKTFKKLLDFCSHFKQLAPFNAMMVQMQRPGASYLLTASQWKRKYGRFIKADAQPIVILSYQPISYLYDISDTEVGSNTIAKKANEILENIKHQYDTKQYVAPQDVSLLMFNLGIHGIICDDKYKAGADFAAKISFLDKPKQIRICANQKKDVTYFASYEIKVNSNLNDGAKYASIMHELGHFFCHHLISPQNKWWERRMLTEEAEEFEAESVAWLTCERLNIENPSKEYLARYLDEHNEIPKGISMNQIFKAHNKIWELLFKVVNAKKGLLYKHDKNFKDLVNGIKPTLEQQYRLPKR